MPSLKMKTKSTTGCLKERNGLRVCAKSSLISKSPLSRARISQNAEEFATVADNGQDVSSFEKVFSQDIRGDEANHNELSCEEGHSQRQESSASDSATDGCMESTPSTCSTSLETIFSPILEAMNSHVDKGSDHLCVSLLDMEDSDDSNRRFSEHQDCNVSDFYISDMIFSGSPIERNLAFESNLDSMILPDYKCEESNLFCNLTEEYMVLPLLEDTLETRYDHDGKASEEIIDDVNDASLYMAIHQLRSYNQDTDNNVYPNSDLADSFDSHIYIRNLPDQLDLTSSMFSHAIIPKEKQETKQITLVLDLDETLVHSTLEFCSDADFTFPVFFNMKEHIVYVKKRPHLQIFLEKVAEMFDIVVFTASQSIYAKQLLDILDPDGKLISRRAYRESCIFAEGGYMKDLTVLGVDLAKIAIIDNSPQVFRLQVNNGIPIKSWFDDPADTALISLLPFLETLVDADDVRPIIARNFGNKESELLVSP